LLKLVQQQIKLKTQQLLHSNGITRIMITRLIFLILNFLKINQNLQHHQMQ
jgi:hypothetical protein